MIVITFVLIILLRFTRTVETDEDVDRHIISCHTTDVECFKRQYTSLRDHILLGNSRLGIRTYSPYIFNYSDTGTCVSVTGVQESQLHAISVDSTAKQLSMELSMPVHIQQIRDPAVSCANPNTEFSPVGPYLGPLKKFSGNASIEVTYPFKLLHQAGEEYLILADEDLDVILDLPDLTNYDNSSELEQTLFELSEWAYSVVQHVDVAEHVVAPYINQIKTVFRRMPVTRFILLYPEEHIADLHFKLTDKSTI